LKKPFAICRDCVVARPITTGRHRTMAALRERGHEFWMFNKLSEQRN